MNKTIWLVTHGETVLRKSDGTWQPDPGMSKRGLGEIVRLRTILNEKLGGKTPTQIHCGVGRRQWEVSSTLGFNDPKVIRFSALWGDAATLAMENDTRMVLLSHGLLIPYSQYCTAQHIGGETLKGAISVLPDCSVICSGRPVLVRGFGMDPSQCHNGALYAFRVQDSGEIKLELVQKGRIFAS